MAIVVAFQHYVQVRCSHHVQALLMRNALKVASFSVCVTFRNSRLRLSLASQVHILNLVELKSLESVCECECATDPCFLASTNPTLLPNEEKHDTLGFLVLILSV